METTSYIWPFEYFYLPGCLYSSHAGGFAGTGLPGHQATNPVFISLMTTLLYRQRLQPVTITSLILCSAGVVLAAWPLIHQSMATPLGSVYSWVVMLVYSIGVLYFSRQQWSDLHILTINGWQTLLGGIFLLPAAAITYNPAKNVWDRHFIGSVLWLAIPVSIVAVQLWLYLLRDNAVKASFWLFLCPVSGYLIANVLMKEPIGLYAMAGMLLVIAGLLPGTAKKTGLASTIAHLHTYS